jgi:VanZ family protein
LFLNSFVENHVLLNKTIDAIGQNTFVRGFPVFFPLAALWFYGDDQKRRARISAGLFVGFLAVVVSILASIVLMYAPTRVKPFC